MGTSANQKRVGSSSNPSTSTKTQGHLSEASTGQGYEDSIATTPGLGLPSVPNPNVNSIQRTILNAGQRRNQTVLALQRKYGNQVVQRALANLTPVRSKNPGQVQRIAQVLPNTKQKLEADSGYASLQTEANGLYDWIQDTVNQDVNDKASRLKVAKALNPETVTKIELETLWSYDLANRHITNPSPAVLAVGVPPTAKDLQTTKDKTVEHQLIDLIRKALAASTARRLKRNADARVVKLRQDLVDETTRIGKDEVLPTKNNKPKN
ncbi:MAG: hypothetical protein J0I20_12710 [Chloroflexi bacterium]|nr:hypothetical protein [Chloroflexota bacterium]OJV92569.1 MAG: hypothetical protein BGO39_32215 [Chloroflexi bacterium 54-19]